VTDTALVAELCHRPSNDLGMHLSDADNCPYTTGLRRARAQGPAGRSAGGNLPRGLVWAAKGLADTGATIRSAQVDALGIGLGLGVIRT
jgi:hypothetical protein